MKTTAKKTNWAIVLLVIVALFAAISCIHLIIATAYVGFEKSAAESLYEMELYSPNGPSESLEEKYANIKDEFKDGSWAVRVASGNTDNPAFVWFALIALLLTSFTALHFVNSYKMEMKKRKEERKQHERELEETNHNFINVLSSISKPVQFPVDVEQ